MLGYCQLLTNIIVNSRANVIKDSFTGVTNGKMNKIAYKIANDIAYDLANGKTNGIGV